MAIDNNKVTALVQKAIDGEEHAIKFLYDYYAKDMFNICVRMLANREDAEDVVQESFIKAFKNLKQLKDVYVFGGWLKQIIINNCITYTKRKAVFEELPEDFEEIDEQTEWLDESSLSAIHDAIKKLPEGSRQIFVLYAIEEYTHKEIGALLSIAESTSKSQYLRAKKLLKQHLKKEEWIR